MSNTAIAMNKSAKCRPITTSRFGELEIDEDKIITMTSPFLGFANDYQFILLPHASKSPFWWLQAVNNPKLAFVVIQPILLDTSYKPEINSQVLQELQIINDQELEILVILTIPNGHPELMTANLLGPVAINTSKKLAKQVLLDPTLYNPCWPMVKG